MSRDSGFVITVLSDNNAKAPLVSEHGFAALVELKGLRILFDTGQGHALFSNAEILQISLENLDILVLSHGHYDHGGNIRKIVLMNPQIHIYAHKDCLQKRYSHHGENPLKYIGLSQENKNVFNTLPENQIHWCEDKTEISEGVYLTGFVPRLNKLEDTGGDFYLDEEMKISDTVKDDLSLWLETPKGLTVLCGCCHSGLENTINHICSFYNSPQIKTVIGGFHLVNSSDLRINSTIKFLKQIDVGKTIGGHCTGDKAKTLFKKELDQSFSLSSVGLEVYS